MIKPKNELHNHLSNLYLFQSVVSLGSFQAAATKYALPRSSVSKKIQQLEEAIGQSLILRSTRKLSLTDAGRDLLHVSESLSTLVEEARQVIDEHEPNPTGNVKISCSSLTGQYFLLPLIQELREAYPAISLELCLSDAHVDLMAQEVDIAIRVGHLPDSSLVARKIGEKSWGWYASPDYLEKHGTPSNPQALNDHQCLVFKNRNTTLNHWPFQQADGDIVSIDADNQISTDDGRALVEMARLGLGIIMIDPRLIKHDLANHHLLPILTDWQHPERLPINLICLNKKYLSRASSCIWDALSIRLKEAFEQ